MEADAVPAYRGAQNIMAIERVLTTGKQPKTRLVHAAADSEPGSRRRGTFMIFAVIATLRE